MSRRHTPAVSQQDKKYILHDNKNELTGRGGGRRDKSVQKNTDKKRYGADYGQGVVEKLDTEADREVDGTTWERMEAGGHGPAKKDTSLARRPR